MIVRGLLLWVPLVWCLSGRVVMGEDRAATGSEARSSAGQPANPQPEIPTKIATFSIVAVDPATGVVGAAVASKYPAVGKVVPYVKAGVGAFCTQHYHNPAFGPLALEKLAAGKAPELVLQELIEKDKQRDLRQLAIIDMKGRAANLNPTAAPGDSRYWGGMTGRFYA